MNEKQKQYFNIMITWMLGFIMGTFCAFSYVILTQ